MSPLQKITELCAGLNFPSEADSPWEVFNRAVGNTPEWPPTAETIRELANQKGDVETSAIADFITKGLIKTDRRYGEIKEIFQDALMDSLVFRVGDVKCTYVIAGLCRGPRVNQIIGMRAQAVET